jgi:hypothetical protein
MIRWLLILTLSVASATASAQPAAPAVPASLAAKTEGASASSKLAERQFRALSIRRDQVEKRYQDELDAIDRLKNQRPSWRRDRELRDSLSSSLETANQLSTATRELERAKLALASTRRGYLAAIEAELANGAPMVRAMQLRHAKAALSPQVRDTPRHIVIPDLEIDPLADPEELDQRAAELRESEDELNHQIAGLGSQAAELDRLALLRKQHERAGYLVNRDDDQPHRNASPKASEATPEESTVGGQYPNSSPPTGAPESYVPIVLAEVIDASTISSLSAAQHSNDPAQRAEAAHRAHDAVVKRLEQVRKRRTEIEARARDLRHKS